MLENQHIKIPKKIETEDNLDFHFLRKTGIKYIEGLGSKLWTDYNSHDPGITTLEVLSYAITDLGMRMNLNMEDILASDDKNKELHKQFIKASEILPSKPVNQLDYRKLFIDITLYKDDETKKVRPIENCWLSFFNETVHVNCKTGNMSFDKSMLGKENLADFEVKGLYKVIVDFKKGLTELAKKDAKVEILKRFNSNRNLCEDLIEIKEVETQKIAVCTSIEVERKEDEELVHAKVIRSINEYLSPKVHSYYLDQLLEEKISTDKIFEGPVLDNGFIKDEELKSSQLRAEVRVSDLIKEIMAVEGVKQIKEISIANCNVSTINGNNDEWLLCIEPGKKPELCDLSTFNYTKGTLPLNINTKKVAGYLKTLEEEEALEKERGEVKELSLPKGTYTDLASYATILNDFPDTYGVGENGIISNPTPERQALAKQLKGYLLFFDKMLASYFKHLDKVKDVLSVNGTLTRTYFTQALKGINEFDELVNNYEKADDDKLTDALYKEIDNNVERRNEVLDHLIARFSEQFNEYTFLMKTLYGDAADEVVLNNKEAFLKDYKTTSTERGLGYNFTATDENLWDTTNISGAQKRIARLLGIKNSDRRNLSCSSVHIKAITVADKTEYEWEVKDVSGNVLFSSIKTHKQAYFASKELYETVYQSVQIDEEAVDRIFAKPIINGGFIGNIKFNKPSANKYYLEVVSDTPERTVIAKQEEKVYTSKADLKKAVLDIIKYFKHDFTEEGMFLVEHLLLKPTMDKDKFLGIGSMIVEDTFKVFSNEQVDPNTYMTSCEEECETNVFDPYSYRVTIVLPGYTYRFSNPDFRKYAETVIREELPAHVLAKICWVGDRNCDLEATSNDLTAFEKTYKKFLIDKSRRNVESLPKSTKDLITAMTNLNNIYRPGRLLDCASDSSTDYQETFILGKAHL
ncbi:MAG: hypothetical protein HRT69_03495 [Flavobacteriaceae bacterium]|nr:hypothetical protein [Flavobacteriaceae bacterium]